MLLERAMILTGSDYGRDPETSSVARVLLVESVRPWSKFLEFERLVRIYVAEQPTNDWTRSGPAHRALADLSQVAVHGPAGRSADVVRAVQSTMDQLLTVRWQNDVGKPLTNGPLLLEETGRLSTAMREALGIDAAGHTPSAATSSPVPPGGAAGETRVVMTAPGLNAPPRAAAPAGSLGAGGAKATSTLAVASPAPPSRDLFEDVHIPIRWGSKGHP
jgi:hypothetical protein